MQILVDTIQDIKDRMDYMLERRERNPPPLLPKKKKKKEDGLGEDFQEDSDREKWNQKTPLKVKQQSKGSNPD